jgi:hypothetical protein
MYTVFWQKWRSTRFEVLAELLLHVQVFLGVTLCRMGNSDWHFEGIVVFRNVVNYLPEDLAHQSFYAIPINFFVIWQRLEQALQDGFEYAAVRCNSDIAWGMSTWNSTFLFVCKGENKPVS